jgi:hypothetical protein
MTWRETRHKSGSLLADLKDFMCKGTIALSILKPLNTLYAL